MSGAEVGKLTPPTDWIQIQLGRAARAGGCARAGGRICSSMTAYTQAAASRLPRGWLHFALQIAIWFGFYFAYQIARGAADRNTGEAFANGQKIIDLQRASARCWSCRCRASIELSGLLTQLTSWTYWLSQFAVLGIALLWVYFWRNERFFALRNTLLLANLIGLVGYVTLPTAPPRMFPDVGFVDTLARSAAVNHGSGVIEFTANPYAAMPSLHAADALIVGVVDGADRPAPRGRRRSGWPGRPGCGSPSWRPATTSGSTSRPESSSPRWRRVVYRPAAGAPARGRREQGRGAQGGLHSRRAPARVALHGRPGAHARHAERAHRRGSDALRGRRRCSSTSSTGTSSCSSGSGRHVFVLGSVLDILDGALARASGKGTPFGAFSTRRSTGSARASCSARSRSSSRATGRARARRSRSRPRRLLPRQLHAREGRGARPQGRRRHRQSRRARRPDHRRPRARAVGRAAVGDRPADRHAWFTVLSGSLHVRKQLRAHAA